MQCPKCLDIGYVILCPDRKPRSLLATVRSIHNFSESPCIAMVPKETPLSVIEEMKKICPVYKGAQTYTSLINGGVGKIKNDWAMVVFAGTTFRPNFFKKYSIFVEDTKDILFPITAGHLDFVTGSINGLLMSSAAIKTIGKMLEISDISQSKLAWADQAMACGYCFKGIAGTRFIV